MSDAVAENVGLVWNTGSITADSTSDTIDMRHHRAIGGQIIFTGTLSGPIYIQGSYGTRGATAATWATLTDDTGAAIELADPAGAAIDVTFNVSDINVPYVRLFYDDTSGTGTIVAYASRRDPQ